MSLTLNMVGGGSGEGGITATDAILRVIATAGSTVTITKGTTTKTDLGHENADDPTLYDYYFIIHDSQFDSVNPWTVLVEQGSLSITKTVIIDSADEYDVSAKILIIYDLGNENTSITGGIISAKGVDNTGYSNGTMTKNADNIELSAGSSRSIAAITTNKIDLTQYKTFKANILTKTGNANGILRISSGYDSSATSYSNISTSGLLSLDITSLTASYYVSARALAASGQSCGLSFNAMYLEG